MKNVLRAGLLFAGVLFAFGITGNAQISRQYTVHIPFDFTVGAKTLKASGMLERSRRRGLWPKRSAPFATRS